MVRFGLVERTGTIIALSSVLLGAFVLMLSAAEEPYHIDELRQTRHYGGSFAAVVNESRGQEQPPLDPLMNSLAQRLIGVGDVRQRLLSVVFATGSLVAVWRLMSRAGLPQLSAATAVGVMALTPALLVVSAYARPYALPLFLMLSFLLMADRWLELGGRWTLLAMGIVAILLPWSRTVEPLIFLVLVATVAGLMAWRDSGRRRRAIAMSVTAGLGLLSGVPALMFVADEIGDRTPAGEASLVVRLGRLLGDVPAVVAEAIQYWPLVLVLVVVVVSLPNLRRTFKRMWWWWVLVGTATGFAVAFAAVAPHGQAFYPRYLFTLIPPIAVLVGVAVTEGARTKWIQRLAVVSVLLILGIAASATWVELTRPSRADWKAVSDVIVDDLPDETTVLYDAVVPLGDYRTPFAGRPRYTGDHGPISHSIQVTADPSRIEGGENTAVVLLTRAPPSVPGWTPISIDGFFTLYLPVTPQPGREGVARAYEAFGESMDISSGSGLRLAAAAIYLDLGNDEAARRIALPVLSDPEVGPAVHDTVSADFLGRLNGDIPGATPSG